MSRAHGCAGVTMFRMNGMSRAHGCAGVTMFRMNGAFVCFCTNDTSAIHGGRMCLKRGAWMRRRGGVQDERVA